jgi:hypothetical protein
MVLWQIVSLSVIQFENVKVYVHELIIVSIRLIYLNGVWLDVDLGTEIKCHVFNRDWTMCPRFVNHTKFHSQIIIN